MVQFLSLRRRDADRIAGAAQTERLIFLSTQLRPIEEAQKMRNLILKGFAREVDYITEQPQQFRCALRQSYKGARTQLMSSARCMASCSRSYR